MARIFGEERSGKPEGVVEILFVTGCA